MGGKLQVKKGAIDKAKSVLSEVAPKEREVFELREAIAQLRQDIEGILAKGYSFDEVAELLTSSGVEVKGTSLKQYMTVFRRQDSRKRTGRKRPEKASQDAKPDFGSQPSAKQVIVKPEPQVVEQLGDHRTVKNSRKSIGRKSSEFVEVSEDL